MSTIADSDYFIINRGDKSYKISAEDVKSELGGGQYDGVGRFDTPVQVVSPVDGAGLTTSATYQPFTPPSLRDKAVSTPTKFEPVFSSADDFATVNTPVSQCGPDGEVYKAQIGEVLSVTKTDFTGALKYSGTIKEGTIESVFDGRSDTYFKIGPNAEFDFTDCNLPVSYNDHTWWYGYQGPTGCFIQVTYTDGTVANSNWGMTAQNDSVCAYGKAVQKLNLVGGDSNSWLSIYGFRVDSGANSLGPVNGNWIRDGLWQLNFAEGSNELRYSVYGQIVAPHNEVVAFAGHKYNSLVIWSPDANSPNPTAFTPGDIVEGPALLATGDSQKQSNFLQITGLSGQWFAGLCVKGSPITASAPSAESVEFTSMNYNTTPVTGTNVSLTNRRWSLSKSSSVSGPWTVVGTYDDDSANLTQNGIEKWEGRPALEANTYQQVKVRYDSGNAPSEESGVTTFKTA